MTILLVCGGAVMDSLALFDCMVMTAAAVRGKITPLDMLVCDVDFCGDRSQHVLKCQIEDF